MICQLKKHGKRKSKDLKEFEPADGFEPPSITNYVIALLLSYTGKNMISIQKIYKDVKKSIAKIQQFFIYNQNNRKKFNYL